MLIFAKFRLALFYSFSVILMFGGYVISLSTDSFSPIKYLSNNFLLTVKKKELVGKRYIYPLFPTDNVFSKYFICIIFFRVLSPLLHLLLRALSTHQLTADQTEH